MDIYINPKVLIDNKLTLSEFLYLKSLYEEDNNPDLFKIMDPIDEMFLQSKGFIKITNDKIILRSKGNSLFETSDLFLRFLNTFPVKTPSGRYLSPLGDTGIAVDKIRAKWDRIFKSRPDKEEKAIKVLEAELNWRKKTNKLEYINSIEAWLNQSNFDKFEYLLQDIEDKKDMIDLM